jgi:hypothetical protein
MCGEISPTKINRAEAERKRQVGPIDQRWAITRRREQTCEEQ